MQVEPSGINDSPPIDNSSPKSTRTARSKSQTPPKVNYKGITLKEYFRLCEQNTLTHQIDELDGESQGSEEEVAQTPTFGLNENAEMHARERNKIKTEIDDQDDLEPIQRITSRSNINKSLTNQKLSHQIQLKPLVQMHLHNAGRSPEYGMNKNLERKRITSIPTRSAKDFLNRSTLSSFYNIEKNKKKMLNKIKTEKDRIQEMRLNDAFSITKYASRFRLDEKLLLK